MGYEFLKQCRSKADDYVCQQLSSRVLEPTVLQNTVVVSDVEVFKSYIDKYRGQPFALDTETTSDNTKQIAEELELEQREYDILQSNLERLSEELKCYTKALQGDSYSSEIKKQKQDSKKLTQELIKDAKKVVVSLEKDLKQCKDPLDPLVGYIGIVQVSWGRESILLRREFLLENLELFTQLLNNAPDYGIYIHNAKFDWKFIRTTFGIEIPKTKLFCTFIAEGTILCGALGGAEEATGMRRRQLSLKACLLRRFDLNIDKGFQAGVDWDSELTDGKVCYAITDVIGGYYLGEFQRGLLLELEMWEAFKMEMHALFALGRMEIEGMTIDYEALQEWKLLLEVNQTELQGVLEVLTETGVDLNYNSPTQLKDYLEKSLFISLESTDESELSKYGDHPFVATLLEYRKTTKALSTYVYPYLNLAKQKPDGSWSVHGEFNQGLLNTGRLSSSNPNLQNVPARAPIVFETDEGTKEFSLREYIIAGEGHYLIGGDLSQVEIRVMAQLANDWDLMVACNNNEDTHTQVASDCLGVPVEDITKEQRAIGKVMNLAIPYGKKPFSISLDLGISTGMAGLLYNNYFVKHPFIKAFMDQCVFTVKQNKYISLPSGRVRHIPEIDHEKSYIVTKAQNRSYNTVIQGTSADGMKMTLDLLTDRIEEEGLTGLVIPMLTVHDEVICRCSNEVSEEKALDILTDCLKQGTQHFCPDVRIEVGDADCGWRARVLANWGDLK